MKAKRLSLVLISLVIFLPLLFISASAHPGRTDSDGGHTDHSTGEYHYHHGYDDHQHYDMDGDGIADCPYLIGAKVDRNIPIGMIVYGIYCIIATTAAIILSFVSDDCLKNGNRKSKSRIDKCYAFCLWSSFPLAVPVFCIIDFVIKSVSVIREKLRAKHSSSISAFQSPSLQASQVSVKDTSAKDASVSLTNSTVPAVSPTYKTCNLIWIFSVSISSAISLQIDYSRIGHIWATLFYIVVKHIRVQNTVNEIYSHFADSAVSHLKGCSDLPTTLFIVRSSYQYYASKLNCSGIDPRTSDGINALWEMLSQNSFGDHAPKTEAKKLYSSFANLLISNSLQYVSDAKQGNKSNRTYSISRIESEEHDLPK